MMLSGHRGLAATRSQPAVRKLGQQQWRSLRIQRSFKGAGSRSHGVVRPLWRPQAVASLPDAAQTNAVEYQVAGSRYSACLRGGSNGTGQSLLRLGEESADSEYVLMLPASLAGVLLQVLHRALQCVNSGKDGCPLELHHTVLQGSRTFKCSLVYQPGPGQLVTVMVQEVGRSCVHLPVSPEVVQPVQQLLQLLQTAAGQQATQQLPAAAAASPVMSPVPTAPQPAAPPAGGAAVSSSSSSSSYEGQASIDAVQEASSDSAQGARSQQQQLEAAASVGPSAGASSGQVTPPPAADGPADVVQEAAAAAETEKATKCSGVSSSDEAGPLPSAAAAAAGSAAEEAAPAAADTIDAAADTIDAAADPSTSSEAAAAPATAPAVSPEVLYAAIDGSTAVSEGFTFAHAAAAEALSAAGSTGPSTAAPMFRLPHLCCLWSKLPVYTASAQRRIMQHDMQDTLQDMSDEELLEAGLLPEVQQELQTLVQVLGPLMQPHLPELPRHMLQRLLQAATDAQQQLPEPFLTAWAAAATAPTARGSWQGADSSGSNAGADADAAAVSGLLKVSMLLLDAGVGAKQQWEQGPVVLPLQWCAYALAESTQATQRLMARTQGLMWGGLTPEQVVAAPELPREWQGLGEVQQLVPVLLAACGHQLQQQQLLWLPWAASHSSSGATACLESISSSLRQLLTADCSQHTGELQDAFAALLPGIQQGQVVSWVRELLQQQQAAAVVLLWSWLAFGSGAQQSSSSLLRTLLEQLPYDQSAAGYAAAAAGDSNSSSSGGAHGSLLEHVLVAHATNSSSSSGGLCAVQQLEALSGLLAHALQADSRAAFAALPSIMSALPTGMQGGSSIDSSSNTQQRWDRAVVELCSHLQRMLQLGPQQLLVHSTSVVRAVAGLATAGAASSKAVLTALQLAEQLATAAASWHAAAAAPELHQDSSAAAGGVAEQVPSAAEVAASCWDFVPAWAQVCARHLQQLQQQQQQQQQAPVLPVLAELLTGAAALHEDYWQHASLAPAWLNYHSRAASSSDTAPWAAFQPVLLSAAASSSNTALDDSDMATAASSLMVLLGHQPPSEALLQAYWDAVGPEALSLSAVGLQQLLWTAAAAAAVSMQQRGTAGSGSSSSSSSQPSGPELLRLASKACSSLAVRPASALSARQAARLTWALAQLSTSQAAAAAGWSPPQQVLAWLRRVWQGMDGTSGSSSSGWAAGAGFEGLSAKVDQLQQHQVLQHQEAAELLSCLQQLELLPGNTQQQQQQQQQERQADARQQPVAAAEESKGQEQPAVEEPPAVPAEDQPQQGATAPPAAAAAPVAAAAAAAAAPQQLHPLLQQQQKLKQQQQVVGQQSKHVVHNFGAARPQAAGAAATATAAAASPASRQETAATEQRQGAAPAEESAAPAAAASSEEPPAAAVPSAASEAQQPPAGTADGDAVPAAAAAAPVEVPDFVFDTLQELRQPSFSPTQRQAMHLLLPVQQYVAALPADDILAYVRSCFQHKVPLSSAALLAATQAAGAAAAAAAEGQGEAPSTSLVLQLLSAMADTTSAAPAKLRPSEAGAAAAAQVELQQQGPQLLQRLLPALGPQQLAAASAAELLQLLQDAFALSTGSAPPARSQLPVGSTLFGTAAAAAVAPAGDSSSSSSSAVSQAWLAAAAQSLEPKLLLFPHGSQLLQCLQLLQALGLQQPGNSFMGSLLAAADALLDTLSGRNCLELLAASAAAGQLPSRGLTQALLQQLQSVKLPAGDVCAGCRLLAALGVRPGAELLLHWFAITEAAAEALAPQQVLQVLWACCVWQVQPPTGWLHAVLKGLALPGRLTACSPASLAGLCRCLWQLGVQPAPGFAAAVAAAAEHGLMQPGASSSSGSNWHYWQQGSDRQQQAQQAQQQGAVGWDAESLSVLCYCLLMWQHSGTPAWKAAVAGAAASLMPSADGPSVLRLGLYLAELTEDPDSSGPDDEQLQPWQRALLQVLPQLLPASADQASGQEVLLAADGSYSRARLLPAWALVVVSYLLAPMPEHSLPVARAMVAAAAAAAEREQLTGWDAFALLPSCSELAELLQHAAAAAAGPLAGLQVQQLQQEALQAQDVIESLLKYAYQHREGAPAAVLQALPAVADQFGVEMPQQSRRILAAAEEAVREREQRLQQALLLQEQGGPAVPEDLLHGWDELGADEAADAVVRYAQESLQAAMVRRIYWLGAAVGDAWVLRGLAGQKA